MKQDFEFLSQNKACVEYSAAPQTTEHNFEDDVEQDLERCGWHTWIEERRELERDDFSLAQKDYDRKLALKTDALIGFVKETQPKEWAKIQKLYGAATEERFLKRVADVLEPHEDRDGLIHTLRRGFSMAPGAKFYLCFFEPANDLNPDTAARWKANRFDVVRQLCYGTLAGTDERDSVDVVLFVNGIPLVTMELKNNLTGQNTQHAVRQYMNDRSTKELLFKPNRRALVHFALDSETVQMCTWLKGENSKFLPFNKGNGKLGAGNPANPDGYRTAYLYNEILAPSSLMQIVQNYVRAEYKKDKKSNTIYMRAVIFPRYHQLDAVRKLVADAREHGTGETYLIQHSAGSGKSNTIAWLAHALSVLHDEVGRAVFDTVVVLTDRRVLDEQLANTVEAVDHKTGVIVRVRDSASKAEGAGEVKGSAGLKAALNEGAKIVTSTIQKFPYICSEVKSNGRRFAVIIDEAHSSQGGKTHAKMKMALAELDEDEMALIDENDKLAEEMAALGKVPNISFFAFTATPKQATLEVFGTYDEQCEIGKDGRRLPRPFHLYSMKQAIEEGFILDVLDSYTCYQQYYKLVKVIQDDPKFKGSKANPALLSIAQNDPSTVAKKASIIVEHFAGDVAAGLDCKAKAMVVTYSRPAAYRLYVAIKEYSKKRGFDLEPMIAFSGTLNVDGKDVTEASLNGVKESETADVFNLDNHRLIVCADKFQTGFDQPKLCAMYVDKRLTGVAAVQTLSRLNRCYPGKFTRVVDFVNDWDTIKASFENYYEATELDCVTDPNVIYDIKSRLDGYRIYEQADIEAVAEAWYASGETERVLQKIEGRLSPAVDTWQALEEGERKLFKSLLRKFCRNYSFIAQMIKLEDVELHKYFCYASLLIKKLYSNTDPRENLHGKVELEYLRIEDKGTRSISLEAKKLHNGAANAGVKRPEEKEYLSILVQRMNELFGTDWNDADKIFHACVDKVLADRQFVAQARNNSMNDVAAVFGDALMNALTSILTESQEMASAFMKNQKAYMQFLNESLLPYVYRKANEDGQE